MVKFQFALLNKRNKKITVCSEIRSNDKRLIINNNETIKNSYKESVKHNIYLVFPFTDKNNNLIIDGSIIKQWNGNITFIKWDNYQWVIGKSKPRPIKNNEWKKFEVIGHIDIKSDAKKFYDRYAKNKK